MSKTMKVLKVLDESQGTDHADTFGNLTPERSKVVEDNIVEFAMNFLIANIDDQVVSEKLEEFIRNN